ncbi:MAG: 23S rRNA (guanosine(2251)-2'-O)-methyltransferase RlmB [Desulfobulbaceae bacterium]|nr:23S rRNA (guanosine(2251)-2'-O)-methyltransferase RlmB [Desulfobulbaceae bacterium]
MANSREVLIWGIHPILETLRHNPELVLEIITQNRPVSAKQQEIVDGAERRGIPVRQQPRLPLPPGAPQPNHQGVMARLRGIPTCELQDLLDGADSPGAPTLVALDSIQDPHNLGAIIRSAAAAGASGVLIPKDRSAPLEGAAAKVAAGSMSLIRICRVTNLVEALLELKEAGYWIFGAEGASGKSIYDSDLSGKACLVIGSEGKGLRPLIRKQCDFLISVPMAGQVESLNASVAAGVMLFEIARQKSPARQAIPKKS